MRRSLPIGVVFIATFGALVVIFHSVGCQVLLVPPACIERERGRVLLRLSYRITAGLCVAGLSSISSGIASYPLVAATGGSRCVVRAEHRFRSH